MLSRCLRTSSPFRLLASYNATKQVVVATNYRVLSSSTTSSVTTPTSGTLLDYNSSNSAVLNTSFSVKPPDDVTSELALAVQNATVMYILYGLGGHRLNQISKEERRLDTLVQRWQAMMEAFFGTQMHVLAGLGYPPNEKGLGMYNQQLIKMLQRVDPDMQEKFRKSGIQLWRLILVKTFNIETKNIPELSIVDARNAAHRISERMQDPQVIKIVKERAEAAPKLDNKMLYQAQKHHILQDVMLHEVYLGGNPSLVKHCGFGDGEEAYIKLQYAMSEHQGDPLVEQYTGAGMMQLIQAAGVDMEFMNKATSG